MGDVWDQNAALKYLGKSGVEHLIDSLCDHAVYFGQQLKANGFNVLNNVVFNQLIMTCETADITVKTLNNIQNHGNIWCGGASWKEEPCIRISVFSWQTTKEDIDYCVQAFVECREKAHLN